MGLLSAPVDAEEDDANGWSSSKEIRSSTTLGDGCVGLVGFAGCSNIEEMSFFMASVLRSTSNAREVREYGVERSVVSGICSS